MLVDLVGLGVGCSVWRCGFSLRVLCVCGLLLVLLLVAGLVGC